MSAPTQRKPRKFAQPCWTQEESKALISAYKDRWSALGQSFLKASDWDSVASTVSRQCPLVSPPKTATQCRQKMEKLRRRFRTEKQRASAYPGRFLSTWDLFQFMSDLECECPSVFGFGSDRDVRIGVQFGGGFLVRKDESYRYLADDFDQNLSDPDEETRKGGEFGDGFRVKDGVRGKGEENSKFVGTFDRYVGEASDVIIGIPVKSLGDRNLGPSDFGTKSSGKSNGKFNPKLNLKRDCSYGAGARSGFDRKFRAGLDSKDVGFEDLDPIEQMASSIEFLGEVFVKMEKEKMEMAREFAKRRMEMEMKQNQLIMESQKQVLAACVDALLESKRRKKKKIKVVPLSPDS